MQPSGACLPPIIPKVHRWTDARFHSPRRLPAGLPSHRRDIRAEGVARSLNQALACHRLLARDRRRRARKRLELDLRPRAEPTPLPIDPRPAALTQDVSPHSLLGPLADARRWWRVRVDLQTGGRFHRLFQVTHGFTTASALPDADWAWGVCACGFPRVTPTCRINSTFIWCFPDPSNNAARSKRRSTMYMLSFTR